jgi:hypothetical protein
MSHPPGPPGPDPAHDPWATPSDQPGADPSQPDDHAPYTAPYSSPGYGPPAYGEGPAAWPYPDGYQVPRTNGKAQAAMWTGLAMLLTSICGVGVLGFIPITLGVLARREIGRSGGRQGGDGMALAGIVTGAVATALSLILIIVVVLLLGAIDSSSSGYGTTGV